MRNDQLPTLNAQRSTTLPREPGARYLTLNVERCVLSVLALFLLAALPARAARDPFWPIGYEPPKPEPVVKEIPEVPKKTVPKPVPPKPKPPAVKPVTDGDWTDARAFITVTGFTRATRPDTGETRTLALINRRSYAAGDTLCITNADIVFLWRIDSLDNRELKLAPIQATRIAPPVSGPSGSTP